MHGEHARSPVIMVLESRAHLLGFYVLLKHKVISQIQPT